MKVKRIIINSLLMLFSVAILVFMAMPYFQGRNGIDSGYDLVQITSTDALLCNAIFVIVTAIFCCILFLLSLFALLRACEVVQQIRFDKIVVWLKMLSVTMIFIGTIISLICVLYQRFQEIQANVFSYKIGWALIVNAAVSILLVTTYLIGRIKIEKKNKKKNPKIKK